MPNQMAPHMRRVNFVWCRYAYAQLRRRARRERKSVGEMIRRAMDAYLEKLGVDVARLKEEGRREWAARMADASNASVAAPVPPSAATQTGEGEQSSASLRIECDSYSVAQRNGRIVLMVQEAVALNSAQSSRNYLTTEQAAECLRLSTRTVRRSMKSVGNPIPHTFIGRHPRFEESHILEWAERGADCVARRAKRALSGVVVPGKREVE